MTVACISMTIVKAQLANTQWKGSLVFPSQDPSQPPLSARVTWEFGKDTARLSYDDQPADRTDVMIYTLDKDTLTLRKVSGGVPCDGETVGKYRIIQKDDALSLLLVDDACVARAKVAALNKAQVFSRVR